MKIDKKWIVIILVLVGLLIISYALSNVFNLKDSDNKIAVIPINGVITVSGNGLGLGDKGASSTSIVGFIEKADKNPSIKGILLEINSPGGSAVASKEIAQAVEDSSKPVVSWIREVGASGAYWISTSSDVIVADELSITGSIGVVGSYLEFSDLFEEYGINYERLVSGRFKDTGSPFRDLNQEERNLLQSKIDQIHEVFVNEVSENREIDKNKVERLATGEFYLGFEALDIGLIDEVGGKNLAVEILKESAGIEEAELVKYEEKAKFFDFFGGLATNAFYFMGKGIGNEISLGYDSPIRLE